MNCKAIIKPMKIFINNDTGIRFRVVSVDNGLVQCRAVSKLQRSGPKIPLDFTISEELFCSYLQSKFSDREPKFRQIL